MISNEMKIITLEEFDQKYKNVDRGLIKRAIEDIKKQPSPDKDSILKKFKKKVKARKKRFKKYCRDRAIVFNTYQKNRNKTIYLKLKNVPLGSLNEDQIKRMIDFLYELYFENGFNKINSYKKAD